MRALWIVLLAPLLLVSNSAAGTNRAKPITAQHDGSNPTTLTGTWYVTLTFSNISTSATLALVQNGSRIVGTLALANGGSGSVSGSVSGNILTFSGTEVAPCPGSFNGVVTISADRRTFSGSANGSDCGGSLSSSIFGSNQSAAGGAKPTADLTGQWDGTLSVSGVNAPFTFTVIQSGSAVTGAVALTSGGGAVFGAISGSDVEFTFYEVSPCAGTFVAGAAILSGGSDVSGSFYGDDCGGQYSGTMTASKR